MEALLCVVCEKEIKLVRWFQSTDGKILSPHGDDCDEHTVFFCGPPCTLQWHERKKGSDKGLRNTEG